jgi:hypothetical protein
MLIGRQSVTKIRPKSVHISFGLSGLKSESAEAGRVRLTMSCLGSRQSTGRAPSEGRVDAAHCAGSAYGSIRMSRQEVADEILSYSALFE